MLGVGLRVLGVESSLGLELKAFQFRFWVEGFGLGLGLGLGFGVGFRVLV